MESKIKEILDKEIRPMLAMHSGDLEFASFSEGIVTLRLKGACRGCPLSAMTLKKGIEKILKSKIPEIKSVEEAK
ncbi:MAG: NifU family protein [Patescibacteria group bacterium]